jgi:hypothetical protein
VTTLIPHQADDFFAPEGVQFELAAARDYNLCDGRHGRNKQPLLE